MRKGKYRLISDNYGNVYYDEDRSIVVYEDQSGIKGDYIGKIPPGLELTDECEEISEKEFLDAYNRVLENVRL